MPRTDGSFGLIFGVYSARDVKRATRAPGATDARPPDITPPPSPFNRQEGRPQRPVRAAFTEATTRTPDRTESAVQGSEARDGGRLTASTDEDCAPEGGGIICYQWQQNPNEGRGDRGARTTLSASG